MIRKSKKEEKKKMDPTSATKHNAKETAGQDIPETAPTSENSNAISDQVPNVGSESQDTDLNDKYLRLYSDFDNFRKRTLKEKIELSKYASADIIGKLLPVLDDFERAIRAFDATTEAGQAVKDGVVLIYNKFLGILVQQGLETMRTAGEKFDTDFHEAITNVPAPVPDQKGRIIDEIEKGYLLHGKVIRYAKVVVGS
jgi:molecular chaperone GrpE